MRQLTSVAIVVPTLRLGGAEAVARVLATELSAHSAVTVITFSYDGCRAESATSPAPWTHEVPDGCAHIHLDGSGRGPLRAFRLVLQMRRVLLQQKFDAALGVLTYTNLMLCFANKLLRRRPRIVLSEHTPKSSLRMGTRGERLQRWMLPWAYRSADCVVCISDAVARDFRETNARQSPPVIVIHNPVSVHVVAQKSQAPVPFDLTSRVHGMSPIVVCVGRLHPHKDHTTVLHAIHRIPTAALILVGDGPLRSQLEDEAAALGMLSRVFFLGYLENPYPLMQLADVIVLASRSEGFGLVAIEAAALQRPFVGSDVPGLGDVCRELGYRTFPVGQPHDLAEAIVAASQMSVSPLEADILKRYEPNRVASRYAQVLWPFA